MNTRRINQLLAEMEAQAVLPEPAQLPLEPAGEIHYRNRGHSPLLGRWLNTDPVGYSEGENLYSFVPPNKSPHA